MISLTFSLILFSVVSAAAVTKFYYLQGNGGFVENYDYKPPGGCIKSDCQTDPRIDTFPRACDIVAMEFDAVIIAMPPFPTAPVTWGIPVPSSYDQRDMLTEIYDVVNRGLIAQKLIEKPVVGDDDYTPPEPCEQKDLASSTSQEQSSGSAPNDSPTDAPKDAPSGAPSNSGPTSSNPISGRRLQEVAQAVVATGGPALGPEQPILTIDQYLVEVHACLHQLLDVIFPDTCLQAAVTGASRCCNCWCGCRGGGCRRCPFFCCRKQRPNVKKVSYYKYCRSTYAG